MKNSKLLFTLFAVIFIALVIAGLQQTTHSKSISFNLDTLLARDAMVSELTARMLVHKHAEAWKNGDEELLEEILHDDVIFAYPGRRLNKEETLEDLRFFRDAFEDTEVYIHNIIVNRDMVAVEWQFASTLKETGNRQVVSDAIIGEIKDGKIIVWKEYLDGRVKKLQASGQLELEEGEEPFPWPMKTDLYTPQK